MADYENSNNSTVITGSAEADSIYNSGATVTISALGGNDTVENIGSYVTIDAGKGDDSVVNSGSNVSIYGGAGNDTMLFNGETVSVSNGDDTISNSGKNVTIDAGTGDDSIANTGSNVSISGGTGTNVINVDGGTGVTVNVKNGDDTIYISDEISSITVKDFGANDEIQFSDKITSFSSISGGVKADSVTIKGLTAATATQAWSGTTKYVETITKGASLSSDGTIIYNTLASSSNMFTISGITSTDNVTVDTEEKSVTVGAAGALGASNVSISKGYTLVLGGDVSASATTSGWSNSGTTYTYKDTSTVAGYRLNDSGTQIIYTPATDGNTLVQLAGIKSNPTVDGNDIELSAANFSTNVTVKNNDGNYSFKLDEGNYSKKSFIATSNADSIYNSGSTISVAGSAGDDYISNTGANVTLSGGNGADTVYNEGDKVTILGGNDDNYIINYGDTVSIISGAGDDSIELNSGENVTVDVASGNDTINLGDVTNFNVKGFSTGDAILLVTSADSLGTVSGGITAGDVTIKGINSVSSSTNQWSLKSGVATYSQKYTAGALLSDDYTITYTAAGTDNLFTISGITSTVGINVDDTTVTISKSALSTSNVSLSGEDYELALADGISGSAVADTWIQSGATYAYKTKSTTAGYDLDRVNNVIYYTAATDGKTVVELTNINIGNAPTVSTNFVELSAGSFSAKNVSVVSNSGKYRFDLDEGNYSKKTFSGSSSADSIYNSGSTLAINGASGNDFISNSGSNVTISGGAGSDTVANYSSKVTVSGGAGNDSIGNWGENVSINAAAGDDSIYNSGNNVTVLGGADNDNIYNNAGANVLFQYSGGNDTINGFSSTDTLQIVSGSITSAYSDGYDAFITVGENTITIEDLSISTNKLNVMDSTGSVSVYTISRVLGTSGDDNLLNVNSNVTVDALAGNDYINNQAANVTISGGADKDTVSSNGNKISINGGKGNDLVNITGGTNVTVNVSEGKDTISLNNDAAKIVVKSFSSGDAIVFADTVSALTTIKGGIVADNVTISGLTASSVSSVWSLDGSDSSYIEKYSAGVVLSDDKTSITYKASGEQSTLFTVSGVKDTAGLALNDSVVVVSSDALDKKDVIISGGYSLALGSDVSVPEFLAEGWYKSGKNYAYKTDETVAGYQTVSSSEIAYYAAAGGDTLVVLGGIKTGSNAPTVSSSKVTFSAGSFKSNVSVASTNIYSFELDSGNYSKKTFTATSSAEEINNYGSTVGIVSGKGNDSIYNYGENVSINAGAGKDYIYNSRENVSISSGASNDSITNEGNFATIATGAGNDSISNNADSIRVQYSGGNDIIEGFDLTDTLQLLSDTITSAYYDGTDAFITVGENTITLKNLSESRINLMNPDDSVSSEYVIPILKGTNDADYLTNADANLTIQALAADDTIDNGGASVTVEGGADNDLINNSSDAVKSLLLTKPVLSFRMTAERS